MPTVNNPYVNPVDLANTSPKYHASQHSKGGFDPLTPADIGAAPADHSHDTPGTIPWDSVTGKPATFSPSVHAATHGSDGGDPIALDASQIASGVVPLERLPHGCLERLVIVANDEARFALTTAQVQQGDTVKEIVLMAMWPILPGLLRRLTGRRLRVSPRRFRRLYMLLHMHLVVLIRLHPRQLVLRR